MKRKKVMIRYCFLGIFIRHLLPSIMLIIGCAVLSQHSYGAASPEGASDAPDSAVNESPRKASFSEEIWFDSGTSQEAKQVQVDVESSSAEANGNLLRFDLLIDSDIAFRDVVITMTIRDQQQQTRAEGRLNVDLYPGDNAYHLEWDASALEPAPYTALFTINYTSLERAAHYELPFTKVSQENMMRELESLEELRSTIATRMESMAESDHAYPYFQIKLALIERFVPEARELVNQQRWREAYPLLNRLTQSANSATAEFAFSSLSPERLEALPEVDFSRVHIQDSELHAAEHPVFLLGVRTALGETDILENLRRFGVNLAVPELSPEVTMSGPAQFRPFENALQRYLDQAEALNMAILPRLDDPHPAGWMLDTWPDLMPEGFLNHAHAAYQQSFNEHLTRVLPFLDRSPNVFSAAILEDPQYKFDSERVRTLFIETIEEKYPDRINLNAAWRSHLASYEEITIWGDYPDHSYQNRRAYQYDWQQFHRDFIDSQLTEVLELARQHAPELHYIIPQMADSFELGETRHNPDRESLARKMIINSVSTHSTPISERYSLDYPDASIYYTLQHSFNPDSLLFDLNARLEGSTNLNSANAYRFANSIVWEAAISGLNAMAIDAGSEVWDQPETLEAVAVANLDINRLAPIVQALQDAPTDVGILFSASSKIFDGGLQHLSSAWKAFEGSSFSGYTVRFVTEQQIQDGVLDELKVLILPETPSLEDATFDTIHEYILADGTICRVGTPIPYTPHGHSRPGVLPSSGNTILVRVVNKSTEFLHAMDAAISLGSLPVIARPVNAHGYPLEGVKTRMVNHEGDTYLYVINLRKDSVLCHLSGNLHQGRDLIRGRDVEFPRTLAPLEPMLIRLEQPVHQLEMTASSR